MLTRERTIEILDDVAQNGRSSGAKLQAIRMLMKMGVVTERAAADPDDPFEALDTKPADLAAHRTKRATNPPG